MMMVSGQWKKQLMGNWNGSWGHGHCVVVVLLSTTCNLLVPDGYILVVLVVTWIDDQSLFLVLLEWTFLMVISGFCFFFM
jgi:hypothetical protein